MRSSEVLHCSQQEVLSSVADIITAGIRLHQMSLDGVSERRRETQDDEILQPVVNHVKQSPDGIQTAGAEFLGAIGPVIS